MGPSENVPAKKKKQSLQESPRRNTEITWDEIGDSFETLGKVGLALAIGMSAAGLFCKLADQGKVRIPSLSSLILNRDQNPTNRQANAEERA